MIENVKTTIENLHAIRELGVKIELDDFGTGYSSLSYLHEIPIDTIKIDRSFVMRMPESSSVRLVKTIVRLAGDLGIGVIAEGVETEEQLECLADMGCTLGQGYLFSRPIAAADAMALLNQTKVPTQKAPEPQTVSSRSDTSRLSVLNPRQYIACRPVNSHRCEFVASGRTLIEYRNGKTQRRRPLNEPKPRIDC